ncbi:MAG: D-alanine-D-alanine ligase, partial [Thermoleophilaceae bacterium]|nr:D-alanine-D-alanine ligase [Thermoleophilaceae bacterium]
VLIAPDGRWSHDGAPVAIEPAGGVLGADVVFPVLHGPFGEDGTVQGALEVADVPYVGAGVLASAVCMDKVVFKDLMARAGVPQVDYVGLWDGDPRDAVARLGTPVFVKPARLGSSVGISKVESADWLDAALDQAFAYDPHVIVEAASPGLEVECSVLGNAAPEASEPGEIVAHADWYDYEAKYSAGGMELVVPARIEGAVRAQVQELARSVFRLAGCAGLARVDFFVEDDGRVLVNELNTMPGFTTTSVYAKLWEASGLPYAELLDRLVELAVERHAAESHYRY